MQNDDAVKQWTPAINIVNLCFGQPTMVIDLKQGA